MLLETSHKNCSDILYVLKNKCYCLSSHKFFPFFSYYYGTFSLRKKQPVVWQKFCLHRIRNSCRAFFWFYLRKPGLAFHESHFNILKFLTSRWTASGRQITRSESLWRKLWKRSIWSAVGKASPLRLKSFCTMLWEKVVSGIFALADPVPDPKWNGMTKFSQIQYNIFLVKIAKNEMTTF